MSNSDIAKKIIVALDSPSFGHAFSIVMRLREVIKTYKMGPIVYLTRGPDGVEQLKDQEVDIFLDLKFHDIPTTVERSVEHVVSCKVDMFTIHSLGGFDMMNAVCKRVKEEVERQKSDVVPKVFAVTVLTSHTDDSLKEIGINSTSEEEVLRLASLAEKAGVDGLVCSGHEVKSLKKEFGERFSYIVPGIRPNKDNNDQKRVVTPQEAIDNGADYIVIGRPITEHPHPDEAVDEIIKSISL